MATAQEAIKRLRYEFTSTGADKVAADANKVRDAVVASSTQQEKSSLSLDKSFANLERRYNANIRAQQDYEKVQRQVNAAVAQNPALQARANEVLRLAAERFNQMTAANDNARGAFQRLAQAVASVQGPLGPLAGRLSSIGTLVGGVGIVFAGASVAVGGLAYAFHQAATASLALADRAGKLQDFSETTGFTVIQLQALEKAAAQVGVSGESVTKGLERFSRQMVDVRKASGDTYDQLLQADAGLAGQVARAESLAEAWDLVSLAIKRAPLEQANKIAVAFFGREGIQQTRLMRAGADAGGISGLVSQMHVLDRITADQAKRWDELGDRIAENMKAGKQNVVSTFAEPTLVALDELSAGFLVLSRAMKEVTQPSGGDTVTSWADGWVSGINKITAALRLAIGPLTPFVAAAQILRGVGRTETTTSRTPTPDISFRYSSDSDADAAVEAEAAAAALRKQTEETIRLSNEEKRRVDALGGAATAQDRLNSKTLEMNALIAQYPGLANEARRNLAAFVEEQQRAAAGARIGQLGSAAGIDEQVAQKRRDLNAAIRDGATFTRAETAAIIERTVAQALGLTQLQAQADSHRTEAAAIGMSIGAATEFRAVQDRLNQARRDGQVLTADQIEAYRREAKVLGDAAQSAALLRVQQESRNNRETLFMSPQEAEIASKLRDIYPDLTERMNSAEAAAMRLNEELARIRDISVGIGKDFLSGLRNNPEKPLKAVADAFAKAAEKMADLQLESLFRSGLGAALDTSSQGLATASSTAASALASAGVAVGASISEGATTASTSLNSAAENIRIAFDAGAASIANASNAAAAARPATFNERFNAAYDDPAKAVQEGINAAQRDAVASVARQSRGGYYGGSPATNPNLMPIGAPNGGGVAMPAVMGVAAVAGAASSGYQSASPLAGGLTGALSGAAAGAMIGSVVPVIGTAIGAVAGAVIGGLSGILGGMFGKANKAKEEFKQAQEEWRKMQDEVDAFISLMTGKAIGPVRQTIMQAESQLKDMIDVAAKAQDWAKITEMQQAFNAFHDRVANQFISLWSVTIESLSGGQGLESAALSAASSMRKLGDDLKGFVADSRYFGDESSRVVAAEAARKTALAALGTIEPLSEIEAQLQRIRGTSVVLQDVLVDLGMSADEAAAAIRGGVTTAINDLSDNFGDLLQRELNAAEGKGALNDMADLLKQVDQMRKDAAALGTEQEPLIQRIFGLKAQDIVNQAELTGDAFREFVAAFPALQGVVTEFVDRVTRSARELDRARESLSDRLFLAGIDTSTQDGALAAFDRQAMREREEEIRSGGELLADLERALYAERLNIVRDFEERRREEEKRTYEESVNFLSGLARNIQEWADRQRSGSSSPLSPQNRLSAAQSQYNAQLSLAQSGDRNALSGITGYADELISAARAFHASSTAFQAIFQTTLGQVEALPDLVSPEQLIVDAINSSKTAITTAISGVLVNAVNSGSAANIATALSTYFDAIDGNTDGLVTYNDIVSALGSTYSTGTLANLKSIYDWFDTDKNGVLDKIELMEGYFRVGGDVNTKITDLESNTDPYGSKKAAELIRDAVAQLVLATQCIGGNESEGLRALAKTSKDQLELLNQQLSGASFSITTAPQQSGFFGTVAAQYGTVNNTLLMALNKIVANTWVIAWHTGVMVANGTEVAIPSAQRSPVLASGGWIGGNLHSQGGTMIEAERGEYVVNRYAAAALGSSILDDFINKGRLPNNDNLRMDYGPAVVSFHAPAFGGADTAALVAEVRALRRDLAAANEKIVRAEIAAAEHVGDKQEETTAAIKAATRKAELLAA